MTGAVTVQGAELVHTPVDDNPEHAIAVVHCTVAGPHLHDTLRAIAGRQAAGRSPLSGDLSPDVLLAGHATVVRDIPPFTIAFLTPARRRLPHLSPRAHRRGWSAEDQWLWALASRTAVEDYPPHPADTARLGADAVRISADWSALVLRDGAAFVGRRRDRGTADPFFGYAELHARTVYLDALLLGILQRSHIDQLTEELSRVFGDEARLARRVSELEHHIAHFRSTYWRQHLTAHGPANDLLVAYQAQHRLPARFAEILAEVTDYARMVQTRENQHMSGALGILTILGLPLSTALAAQQVLGDSNPWHLLLYLGAALTASAGLLTTRYGRLALSALRGQPRGRRRYQRERG